MQEHKQVHKYTYLHNTNVYFSIPQKKKMYICTCICIWVCIPPNTPNIVVYTPETQNSLVSIQIHLYPSIRLPSTPSQQHKAWNDLIYNTISLATDSAFDTY